MGDLLGGRDGGRRLGTRRRPRIRAWSVGGRRDGHGHAVEHAVEHDGALPCTADELLEHRRRRVTADVEADVDGREAVAHLVVEAEAALHVEVAVDGRGHLGERHPASGGDVDQARRQAGGERRQQDLGRVRPGVGAAEDRRLPGVDDERLGPGGVLLQGAVERLHVVPVVRAAEPGVAGAELEPGKLRLCLDGVERAEELVGVDSVADRLERLCHWKAFPVVDRHQSDSGREPFGSSRVTAAGYRPPAVPRSRSGMAGDHGRWQRMKVFQIGAAGGVGRRVARLLADAGHESTGMHRNPAQAESVRAAGATPLRGDLIADTVDTLAGHLRGHDAVVFSAGAHGTGLDQTSAIDGKGLEKAADAAALAGVARFVLVSAFPEAWRERERSAGFEHYIRVKKAADAYLAGTDLDWIILRPGDLLDTPGSGRVTAAAAVEYGAVPRDDVAAFIVAALGEPALRRAIVELTSGPTPVVEAVARLAEPGRDRPGT